MAINFRDRTPERPRTGCIAFAILAGIAFSCGIVSASESPKYGGKVYVAGHGGHVAAVRVTIDPNNPDEPIKVRARERDGAKLDISEEKHENGTSQYKLHDVRLDGNMMYWSTYNTDANGNLHYGVVDLSDDNKVVADIAVPVDPRATKPAIKPDAMPYYCASGQTKGYFMPITMTNEAYITVVDKKDLKKSFNVFLDSVLPDANYKFMHGSTDPTGTKFLAVVNLSDVPHGNITGEHLMFLLDAKALEQGKVVKLAEGLIFGDGTGPFGASITFRSNWSGDGSKIFLAGGDRVWVIDANDPELRPLNGLDGDPRIGGQAHDMLPTSDAKYALITVRTKPYTDPADAEKMDGALQLYDVANSRPIGEPVSVCNVCHRASEGDNLNAVLCGMDGHVTPM
jgi:hypothetical protein